MSRVNLDDWDLTEVTIQLEQLKLFASRVLPEDVKEVLMEEIEFLESKLK